jgi:hypothetical protein
MARRPDLIGNPYDFQRLVEDLNYPTVTLGVLRVDGRQMWEAIGDRLTPGERRQLLRMPAFRRRLLVATAGARSRVRHWLNTETPIPAQSSAERRAWIHERVWLYGDEDFLPIITQAVVHFPDVVLAALLPAVAFIGVGRNSRAWFVGGSFIHRNGHRLRHTIVLGPATNEDTVRHECGHAFCAVLPTETDTPALSVLGEQGVLQLAADEGWSHRIDEHQQREERLAWGFAYAWAPGRDVR